MDALSDSSVLFGFCGKAKNLSLKKFHSILAQKSRDLANYHSIKFYFRGEKYVSTDIQDFHKV